MGNLGSTFEGALTPLVDFLSSILFYNISGFPFIVLWLVVAAVFFTYHLNWVNVRLVRHAFDLVTKKRKTSTAKGEVSQMQALLSAVAATVGLGSIAGVSVAVAIGGPGAVFWIVVMGLFGMSTKFAEVTLSMKYRKIVKGKVYGGPIQYLKQGLAEHHMPQLGKALAGLFALFCLGGALGGGNMFQSNQTVKIITHELPMLAPWVVAAAFATLVGLVLFGSIQRIAKVAEKVAPAKGIVYLACAVIIVFANIENLPHALGQILSGAFSADGVKGGFIGGLLAVAFKRALFANEAGLGSAPIAHAAAKVKDPAQEGTIAMLEPLFAAGIAFLTGLIVVITGAHEGATLSDGVLITAKAFSSVGDWFTILLAINVFIFAYGTTIGWSYYGEIAWSHLFGRTYIKGYYLLFAFACFVGGVTNFGVVLDLSDLLILGMALPNVIALYVLRNTIKREMKRYMKKVGV